MIGQIYALCKDQHGCRYLQRQLDEPNNPWRGAIYEEIEPHFVELMTGTFFTHPNTNMRRSLWKLSLSKND
jgi:hypothetical protein